MAPAAPRHRGSTLTPVTVDRTSALAAPPDEVWRHATSMAGINAELSPIAMTHPPTMAHLPNPLPQELLGRRLFTSTLKLGPVPFDRHRLVLTELDDGRHFQEDSTTLLNRRWRHRRTVRATATGCEVHDELEVEPRVPGAGVVTRWLVGRIFDRRHRYLVATFGRG